MVNRHTRGRIQLSTAAVGCGQDDLPPLRVLVAKHYDFDPACSEQELGHHEVRMVRILGGRPCAAHPACASAMVPTTVPTMARGVPSEEAGCGLSDDEPSIAMSAANMNKVYHTATFKAQPREKLVTLGSIHTSIRKDTATQTNIRSDSKDLQLLPELQPTDVGSDAEVARISKKKKKRKVEPIKITGRTIGKRANWSDDGLPYTQVIKLA